MWGWVVLGIYIVGWNVAFQVIVRSYDIGTRKRERMDVVMEGLTFSWFWPLLAVIMAIVGGGTFISRIGEPERCEECGHTWRNRGTVAKRCPSSVCGRLLAAPGPASGR